MTARITAFVNQKGGVGKTTSVFHLTRAAYLCGKRVLIIDNDPQGSITTIASGEQPPEGTLGVADVLSRHSQAGFEDVIIPGCWDRLFIAPTVGESLGFVRDELVISGAGRERKLLEALKPILEDFDHIFIDCGPSLDLLTINALTAADAAVIVTQTQLLSAKGLKSMLQTVKTIRTSYNPALEIAGIVVNGHDDRTISGKQWLEEIEAMHPITRPLIPRSIAVSNSAEAARGLDQWTGQNEKSMELSDMYLDHFRALEGAH